MALVAQTLEKETSGASKKCMNKSLKTGISRLIIVVFVFFLGSCDKDRINNPEENLPEFLSAVDISSFPEISDSEPVFYDMDANAKDFLSILKENGINTIRLRLWHKPADNHCGLNEVKHFSEKLKSEGFKIWLCVHYSDTWADPSKQILPADWEEANFPELKDSVYNYTAKILKEIDAEYIQIGNEINSGLLHPYGKISDNAENFKELLAAGISAVRNNTKDTQIILHYAGINGADYFFDRIKSLDYDIIGLSYYPIWHGKSISDLEISLAQLSETFNKKILIAETAYPFTTDWDDMTNNIVGLEEQLILPAYPATKDGQRKFVSKIKDIIFNTPNGLGFCYWGAELIAWKGCQATDGSTWENQALFDFENKAVRALEEFK